MRPIDADKLKAHYSWWDNEEQRTFDQIVDAQPTVDAVPVVRCMECEGWVATENSDLGLCVLTKRVVTRRDYCSEGKRKDGGGENDT